MFDRMIRGGTVIHIPASQIVTMRHEAQIAHQGNETGGIAIGRTHSAELKVTVLGPPGPNAIHERDYFLRDLQFAQSLALAAWQEDQSEWIGEWHTHPHSSLAPSEADVRTYRKHLDDPELRFDTFLSVISKLRGDDILVTAWVVSATEVRRIGVDVIADV